MMFGGRSQAVVALILAGLAGWVTIATTTRFTRSTTQFVGFGLAIFLLAVVAGSRFAVGGAVMVALAGAVIEIGTAADQGWDRPLIIACLWYAAAELAWDSMECRDGRNRSPAAALERLGEVATVLVASLVAIVLAVAIMGSAPPRTLAVLAATVGVLAIGLIAATRQLAATDSNSGAATDG